MIGGEEAFYRICIFKEVYKMAKETISPEEKRERRKKRSKYLGIACIAGFAFLLGTIVVRDYRNKQDEKMRLSTDRNAYYKSAFENKDRDEVSKEFFNEMFLGADQWYSVESDRADALQDMVTENKGDLSLDISLYNGLRSSELECQCSFEEDLNSYAEFLEKVASALWDSGENGDITLRLFSDNGNQVSIYLQEGDKYIDYFFVDSELEKEWEGLCATTLSEFKTIEYEELVLDDKLVKEKLEKYGTVIPYMSDKLIEAYNDEQPIKIVLKSDEYLGYDYLSDSQKNTLIDENYNESLTEGDQAVPQVENSSEDKYSHEEVTEVPEQTFTPIEGLDYNTKTDVVLSPEDYSTYCTIVEENDLNYNSHIKLGEDKVSEEDEEQYYDSKSWVCVFGNKLLFDDITYMSSNLQTSNISYQLMYYLYQISSCSYDLSIGMEDIIKNFS